MLINELNIQRFRGVASSIELDFTAPLTIIYAPNGTGKTSICDAAEWLLCGYVGRLNTSDQTEIRCKFGEDNLDTFVEAKFEVNNKSYALKRFVEGGRSVLNRKIGTGDYSKVTDSELLRELVSAIPPSGTSPKGQVSWVRSTRFLENDSLSLLIDSDDESNDTRKLIFSNLFGVGEYQKAESELNRILGKLPAASTITREKLKTENKITDYNKAIDKLISDQGESYRDHAINLLSAIAKHLKVTTNIEESTSLNDRYNQLEVLSIKSMEALEGGKENLSFIRNNLYLYQDKLSKKVELEESLSSENKAYKTLDDTFSKNKGYLEKKKTEYNAIAKEVVDITNALESLKTQRGEFSRLYEIYMLPDIGGGVGGRRLDGLSAYVDSKNNGISEIRKKLIFINECVALVPSWVASQDEIKGIAIELDSLLVDQEKNKENVSLPERMSKVKTELDTLKSSRDKVLGEVDLILTSGKKYLESNNDVSECPLCEFKYESNAVLLGRIEGRYAQLSDNSKQESSLAAIYSDLTMLLQQENSRLKQIQELTSRRGLLLQSVKDLEEKFLSSSVSKNDLIDDGSLTVRLENIRIQYLDEVNTLSVALKLYVFAFEAGENLEGILRWFKPVAALWSGRLGLSGYEEPKSLDDLDESFVKLEGILSKRSQFKMDEQEREKLKIGEDSAALSKVEDEKKRLNSLLSSVKKAVFDVDFDINNFKNKWAAMSKSPVIDMQEIEVVSSGINEKVGVQNEIKSMFQKVHGHFEKIREAEKKEGERGTYLKEVADAESELREWTNQEEARSVIENEINAIKEEIRRFIASEIQPLSSIINTLYLRAQGNRFINSIEARPSKEGFLDWVAALDDNGEAFDKMRSLSQGQRQDLALSIFLARARSLGGTFFLDEPLAHLDDLNRVALLDTLRIIVSENRSTNPLRLVLTTASNSLLRHMREKFSLVEGSNGEPALRIYKMKGNPKVGLQIEPPELVHSPNRLLASI
jgi:exonuclease SbcC